MYRTVQAAATLFVVVVLVALVATSLYVGWWGLLTFTLAIFLGIFAQDIVEFLVNTMLGLPAGPRHKSRRNA